MQSLKELVEESYNAQADLYATSSRMQSSNMIELLRIAKPYLPATPAETLDIGCGTGTIAASLASADWISTQSYLGIDLSSQMISLAKRRGLDDRFQFMVGDAENLPATNSSYSLILSNSALHWLNQPSLGSTPEKAFNEIGRCLKPDGLCSLSLAAVGTGRHFNSAYRRILDEEANNDSRFQESLYLSDPIGCVELFEVVNWTMRAGLEVVTARLVYEPILFDSAMAYCQAVKAYGFSMFMAAVTPERREHVWHAVCEEFAHPFQGKTYFHDQFMCYLVARKLASSR